MMALVRQIGHKRNRVGLSLAVAAVWFGLILLQWVAL